MYSYANNLSQKNLFLSWKQLSKTPIYYIFMCSLAHLQRNWGERENKVSRRQSASDKGRGEQRKTQDEKHNSGNSVSI